MENTKNKTNYFFSICLTLLAIVCAVVFTACGDKTFSSSQIKSAFVNLDTKLSSSEVKTISVETSKTKSDFGFDYAGLYHNAISEDEKTTVTTAQTAFKTAFIQPIVSIVNSTNYNYSDKNIYVDNSESQYDIRCIVKLNMENKTIYTYQKCVNSTSNYTQYNIIALQLNDGGTDWQKLTIMVYEKTGDNNPGFNYVEITNALNSNLIYDKMHWVTGNENSILKFVSFEFIESKFASDVALLDSTQKQYLLTSYITPIKDIPTKINEQLETGNNTIQLDYFNDDLTA